MKKAIYYAILQGMLRYRVMAVTSEKKTQIFGRWDDDEVPTHASKYKIKRQYATREEAYGHLRLIESICARFKAVREPLQKQISQAYKDEQEAIDAL